MAKFKFSSLPRPPLGFLYAIGGSTLLVTNFITAKIALQGFTPETFGLVWSAAATIYGLLFLLLTGRWRSVRVPHRSLSKLGLIGVLNGIGLLLGWAGLNQLDPAFAAFLWRFLPAETMLLGMIFLGERLQTRQFGAAGLMLAGGLLGAFNRWEIVGPGVVLILLATIVNAIQNLVAKLSAAEVVAELIVLARVGVGVMVIALWTFGAGRAVFDVPARFWIVTLIASFFGEWACWLLFYKSYEHWELTRTSMVRTAEPLLVIPLSGLILGMIPHSQELLGGGVILLGAFLLIWWQREYKTDGTPGGE